MTVFFKRPGSFRLHLWVPPMTAVSLHFADDISTSRETAFAKIKSRVDGTLMASKALGV